MTIPTRCLAVACVLIAAASVQAADGGRNGSNDLRVAVIVDMTPEGRKVSHPSPDHPAYYIPVIIGYKELGDHLKDFQRPPPPPDEVQRQLVTALADQGYLQAGKPSSPSLILVFRWGYLAPQVVLGYFANRDVMMTYTVGNNWADMQKVSDPQTTELLSELNSATTVSGTSVMPELVGVHVGPVAQGASRGRPVDMAGPTHMGARYFLMVSALDYRAYLQHKSVLLWRAHVSVNYWGHYLDETLPALIAAGAPYFGRETAHPLIRPASIVPMGRVIVGTPELVRGKGTITLPPSHLIEDEMQAKTAQIVDNFAAGAQSAISGSGGQTLAGQLPSADEANAEAETSRDESSGGVVRLPPYIVEDRRKRARWLYVSIPGYEVLSATTLQDTEKFAQMMYLEKRWLDEIAPPSLQARNTVPTALILLTGDFRREFSGRIAALFRSKVDDQSRGQLASTISLGSETQTFADLIQQVKLNDQDSLGVDILLEPGKTDVALDPEFVYWLLANRAPSLPSWFVVGVSGLWRDWVEAFYQNRESAMRYSPESGDTLHLPPMGSLPGRDMAPLPLESVLGPPPADLRTRTLWAEESDLLVRWALADNTGARRESLWRLVDLSSSQPASEAMFQECFGLTFNQALQRLDDFVGRATSSDLILVPLNPIETPWIDPRMATESEVARILGDWQRKEVGFVSRDHPQFAGEYAAQAGETLNAAYEQGIRDPNLVAALGLYECAMGDDRRARGYLETAVAEKVARPRAYVELARIRLNDAMKRPAGSRGRLDRPQAASIISLIQSTLTLDPPQADGFVLAAETWEHADFVPAPADLKLLDEGLYYFPREGRLVLAAAQLDAVAGLRNRAMTILDCGLQDVADPRMRQAFAYLRSRYTSP